MYFLDTVGLIAIWDDTDQWHEPASRSFDDLIRTGELAVTTPFVLAECANAAARRPYRLDVANLCEQLEAGDLLVVPTAADWHSAWDAYRRGDAAGAGVVDHLSFAVMRRLGLTRVFTNDRHFRAAGFEPLF